MGIFLCSDSHRIVPLSDTMWKGVLPMETDVSDRLPQQVSPMNDGFSPIKIPETSD